MVRNRSCFGGTSTAGNAVDVSLKKGFVVCWSWTAVCSSQLSHLSVCSYGPHHCTAPLGENTFRNACLYAFISSPCHVSNIRRSGGRGHSCRSNQSGCGKTQIFYVLCRSYPTWVSFWRYLEHVFVKRTFIQTYRRVLSHSGQDHVDFCGSRLRTFPQ